MSTDADRAWEIMQKLSVSMVVSQSEGEFHSRPVAAIVKSDEQKVYFISVSTSPQIEHIANGSAVMLNFSNGSNQFLAAHADATISDDRALIKRLWNVGAQTFWPEGPEKAPVTVIIATPTRAEFWDGPSQLVSAARMVFALATGTKPNLGDNADIRLQSGQQS